MRLLLVIILIVPLLHAGCTSFKTMSLGRLDSDSLYPECFGKKKKGIPVKLKVPTHVVVSIHEQQVLVRGEDGVRLQSFSPPQYEVESELSYTDKVFLVDFARPAGGSLTIGENGTNGITFDDDQYFKTIKAKVEEQTMLQIGTALGTVSGALTSSEGVVKGEDGDHPNLKFEKSIIACQRFDLARPNWEHEVNGFVQQYIMGSKTCPVPLQKPIPPMPSSDPKADLPTDQKQFSSFFRKEAPPALELLE